MSEEKRTSIFRKKSEEYIDSPEKLDNYLHVTNPGVWSLLVGVLILLLGFGVWACTGQLETNVTVAVVSSKGECAAYVPESAVNAVVSNRSIEVDGKEYALNPSSLEPISVTDTTNVYLRVAGDLSVGDIMYEIPMEGDLKDGVYSGKVTTETITPMSLLLN